MGGGLRLPEGIRLADPNGRLGVGLGELQSNRKGYTRRDGLSTGT